MKYPLLLILFFTPLAFAGCKKSGSNPISKSTLNSTSNEPITLIAKWSLVNDSTAYGLQNLSVANYAGVTGDYFDFRADGNCYIKEGARYDTLTYSMVARDSVIIAKFNYGFPLKVSPFTTHNATIFTPGGASQLTPGAYNYRLVNLKR